MKRAYHMNHRNDIVVTLPSSNRNLPQITLADISALYKINFMRHDITTVYNECKRLNFKNNGNADNHRPTDSIRIKKQLVLRQI